MEGALGWIGDIAQWVRQFFPKWVIVPTTHAAVKWVRGSRVEELGAGIHWYWPLVTILRSYPIVRQSVDLRPQVMISQDGKVFSAGVVMTYTVESIRKLLTSTYDPDEVMSEISLAAVYDVLTGLTWQDIQEKNLTRKLTGAIQQLVRPYGVHVVRAGLTELAPCRVLKLLIPPSPDQLVPGN